MHTILGAGGAVSNNLATVLLEAGKNVKLASRKPVSGFKDAVWEQADLRDPASVLRAIEGSSIVYITAGLKYDSAVWKKEWPLIAANLVEAGKRTGVRMIFFDNVYMYGRVEGAMTEDSPYRPVSKKGEVRARIAELFMQEARQGNINFTIARAADFYGADSMNSFFDSMVLARMAKGQKPMWLGDPQSLHSLTYVGDTGKSLLALAEDAQASNQVWHLPTAPPLRGSEFIRLASEVFGRPAKFMRVNKLMLQAIGLFNPLIREVVEMYYQYQHDYVFNSAKFENHFGIAPSSYQSGIQRFSNNAALLAKK